MKIKDLVSLVFQQKIFLIAVAGMLLIMLAPMDLAQTQKNMLGVWFWVLLHWLATSTPLGTTATMGVALCAGLGLAPIEECFRSYGSPIIFLFMGGFLLAKAVQVHGLDQWIARLIFSGRWVKQDNPQALITGMLITTVFLSSWLSNTATVAMMIPLALQLARLYPNLKNLEKVLLFALGYGATIGGNLTPVGTPPNAIAMGFIREQNLEPWNFLTWMLSLMPLVLLGTLFLRWRLINILGKIETGDKKMALPNPGPLTVEAKMTAAVFLLVVAGWVTPGIVQLLQIQSTWAQSLVNFLPESAVAIMGGGLLLILSTKNRPLLHWEEAKTIDWDSLLLFGGGMSLGSLFLSTGLAQTLANLLPTALSPWWPMTFFVMATITLSEFLTNSAAANLMLPLFIAVMPAEFHRVGIVAVTLGCNLAFCFPMGTPPNALIYSTKKISLKDMVLLGGAMNAVFSLLIVLWAWIMMKF